MLPLFPLSYPFIAKYVQIIKDLTNGQAKLYDFVIRIGLVELVTIHTFYWLLLQNVTFLNWA
jgi:hypothetical protein